MKQKNLQQSLLKKKIKFPEQLNSTNTLFNQLKDRNQKFQTISVQEINQLQKQIQQNKDNLEQKKFLKNEKEEITETFRSHQTRTINQIRDQIKNLENVSTCFKEKQDVKYLKDKFDLELKKYLTIMQGITTSSMDDSSNQSNSIISPISSHDNPSFIQKQDDEDLLSQLQPFKQSNENNNKSNLLNSDSQQSFQQNTISSQKKDEKIPFKKNSQDFFNQDGQMKNRILDDLFNQVIVENDREQLLGNSDSSKKNNQQYMIQSQNSEEEVDSYFSKLQKLQKKSYKKSSVIENNTNSSKRLNSYKNNQESGFFQQDDTTLNTNQFNNSNQIQKQQQQQQQLTRKQFFEIQSEADYYKQDQKYRQQHIDKIQGDVYMLKGIMDDIHYQANYQQCYVEAIVDEEQKAYDNIMKASKEMNEANKKSSKSGRQICYIIFVSILLVIMATLITLKSLKIM